MLYIFLTLLQLTATAVMTIYFMLAVKDRTSAKTSLSDTSAEAAKLRRLREISLAKPLTEVLRPEQPSDIIGQERGMRALKYALCGENPQHVIIYGPPGVGKTAAARIALELAKQSEGTPFKSDAPFVEADATIMQFDERAIADPLLGSVHDPIYQGAGAYGSLGVPRPRAGAVTKAHGGVLFLDEIGELGTYHLNRLLKVLEEGKVRFYSSYYSNTDRNIPGYIHDIFKNGMPADFRLIGATTRSPEELPPALRSRCREIFFDELDSGSTELIARRSLLRLGAEFDKRVPSIIGGYASNGRECVSMVQDAWSAARAEKRRIITEDDIRTVIGEGGYSKRNISVLDGTAKTGVVNGLAVCGMQGRVLKIEANASRGGCGLEIRGAADSESIKGSVSTLQKRGSIYESAENVLDVLEQLTDFRAEDYRISINFPESRITDGPSAGAAMLLAVYSAVYGIPVRGDIALTGELGLKGDILPVGGAACKVRAALAAGAKRVYIPSGNANEVCGKQVSLLNRAEEVLSIALARESAVNM